MPTRRNRDGGQDGNVLLLVAAALALLSLVVMAMIVFRTAARITTDPPRPLTVERDVNPAFVKAWSASLGSPFTLEMANVPGRRGEFYALQNDVIHRFDAAGERLEQFAAPPKSSRIATDGTGAIPLLLVVSRKTKWTGAIDYVVTTDYFLNALNTRGQVAWTKRLDPKQYSVLEAVIARNGDRPMIVLSASDRILAFDPNGTPLWDIKFWHHPGSVAIADLNGDGRGDILAAKAPLQQIFRINALGEVGRAWGAGDGPRRLRTTYSPTTGFSAISLRQVFGRGPGVGHALTFFDYLGQTIREVELPPDASTLSYAPVTAMDVDGSGNKVWVVAFGDGSIHAYSPFGERLAQFQMDVRPRTYLAVPQPRGADLLVTATDRGLIAWRPIAARFSPR